MPAFYRDATPFYQRDAHTPSIISHSHEHGIKLVTTPALSPSSDNYSIITTPGSPPGLSLASLGSSPSLSSLDINDSIKSFDELEYPSSETDESPDEGETTQATCNAVVPAPTPGTALAYITDLLRQLQESRDRSSSSGTSPEVIDLTNSDSDNMDMSIDDPHTFSNPLERSQRSNHRLHPFDISGTVPIGPSDWNTPSASLSRSQKRAERRRRNRELRKKIVSPPPHAARPTWKRLPIPLSARISPHLLSQIFSTFTLNPALTSNAFHDLSESERTALRIGVISLHNRIASSARHANLILERKPILKILDHHVFDNAIDYRIGSGPHDWVRDINIGSYPAGNRAVDHYWGHTSNITPRPIITPRLARQLRLHAPQYQGVHGVWLDRFTGHAERVRDPRTRSRV
ncbi:hypothetical protein PUNSTDRAFT_135701 [Punctularia strigosozonata HHB-11173 SS5]|uniref:uncharacterized protein n=1 Tax=Punctularia strigosozonata (strain HHB-11173) TaxID=741275 RepID=UPI000441651A|nr:uncharacterized protein PUNSTDRAFT_135701 [Punctularia strigosozonata HHB-11173 SS5]EIN07002.1 hypothetical protein PUNSTDRAFT_135701 [Punctularia strigosozonata HHB-11173 SS5]